MEETTSTARVAGVVAALALLATAATPVTAAAQETFGEATGTDTLAAGHGRSGLEMNLSAVLLTPLTDLVGGTGTTGALQLSTGVGIRAGGVWWLGPRLGIGIGGVWAPVDVDRQASIVDDGGAGGADPGGEVGEADYLAGTADLVVALPAVSREVRIEPYLVAGLGLRHLSIDAGAELPDEITDPLASFGGGFRMLLSERLLMLIEARDQVAPADLGPETRIQHDLTVSVGLGVRP